MKSGIMLSTISSLYQNQSVQIETIIIFHKICTTSESVSFSWMFISIFQETQYVRFKMTTNGWLGRGRSEGVFRLSGSLWLSWCYRQPFFYYIHT